MKRAAWILASERQPVSVPTAPALRLERMRRWLSRCGYEPVLTSRLGGALDRPPAGAITYAGGRGTLRTSLDAAAALVAAPRVALRAVREAPALILANTPVQAPALALAKLCLGRRAVAVADVMGLHSLEAAQTARSPLARSLHPRAWRLLERLLFRSADIVFVVNDRHRELVESIAPGARVETLRDCAEADPQVSPVRSNGEDPERASVAFLGALVCGRLDPVLDAWEVLGAEPAGPRLIVVGDGPDLDDHRRRVARSAALAHSVTLAGALPRARALGTVAACDAACGDCWSEAGFPAKAFEYMALGLPALIQDRPQVREVLEHGETALLWADPDALIEQVRALAGNADLRARLGEAGRATLLEAHTEESRERCFHTAIAHAAGRA